MRVYLTRPLLRIVEGVDHTLNIRGRLGRPVSAEIESRLAELPKMVATQFNFDTKEGQTVDFASSPIVYMPDEFTFFLDIESLGRLAREFLIQMIPLDASAWGSRDISIAELWVGGRDEILSEDERAILKKTIREVQAMPVRGKVFVLDETSFRSHARLVGSRDAIREANGIVHEHPSAACDYYVTDRRESAEVALRGGAKQVVNALMLSVMLGSRD